MRMPTIPCGEAEQERFGEELADDAGASCAEDGSDAEFVGAADGACEEKIGQRCCRR